MLGVENYTLVGVARLKWILWVKNPLLTCNCPSFWSSMCKKICRCVSYFL